MNNIERQLNFIKQEIVPRPEWKDSNRDILISQIYGTEASTIKIDINDVNASILKYLPLYVVRSVLHPTMAVIFVFVMVAIGGFTGTRAAKNTKPGDSLYIAKIVSEKTQLALTFDEKKKAKLRIGFAGERAGELEKFLAEPESIQKQENKEKVEMLITNFKNELVAAKIEIAKLNTTKEAVSEMNATDDVVKIEESGDEVFSANIKKEENGISISDNQEGDSLAKEISIAESGSTTKIVNVNQATSSDDVLKSTTTDPKLILLQAGESLEANDVEATLNLLSEAGNVIEKKSDSGEVRGVDEEVSGDTETASSASELK